MVPHIPPTSFAGDDIGYVLGCGCEYSLPSSRVDRTGLTWSDIPRTRRSPRTSPTLLLRICTLQSSPSKVYRRIASSGLARNA
eukprot:1190235-Prorocentrum_minimum.AAC.1